MPWNGSGTFNRVHDFTDDAAADIQAQADRFDAEFDGIVTGLENCQTLDGQTTPTAIIPMGGFKHAGVAAATSADQYLRYDQVASIATTSAETTAGVTPTDVGYPPGDVRRYGAVGDGSNDDTTAIQNAIDIVYASNATQKKGDVYIPAGTYLVTGLNIPYQVAVRGEARDSTVIKSNTNAIIVELGNGTSASTDLSDFTIEGSDNVAHTAQHGISYDGVDNVLFSTFERIEIRKCGGSGIHMDFNSTALKGMYDAVFRSVKSTDNHNYGYVFTGGLPNVNLFEGCIFTRNAKGGVYYHTLTGIPKQNTFNNCDIATNGADVLSHPDILDGFGVWVDHTGSSVTFNNCFFEANGTGNASAINPGIKMTSPSYLGLRGCIFSSHKYHVVIDASSADTRIYSVGNRFAPAAGSTPAIAASFYLDGCTLGRLDSQDVQRVAASEEIVSNGATGIMIVKDGVIQPEALTSDRTIAADESGKTFYLDSATGFNATLPAPAAGLKYKFIVSTAPTTTNAHLVLTDSGDNIMYGTYLDIVGELTYFSAQDRIKFVINVSVIGDSLEVESDGTNWYCTGITGADGGIDALVT